MSGPDIYCELHAHSNFSFLDGASHPEDLVAQAALLRMPALALTDHAGLYAAVRLWKAARETETDAARAAGLAPVRPIIGLELAIPRTDDELRLAHRGRKLNDPVRAEKASRGWPGELHAGPTPGDHLVLVARDTAGYTALSRLASRGHLAGEKQFPVFERALVEAALDEARGHLVGLSGCRNGEVPRRLTAGEAAAAREAAERWESAQGRARAPTHRSGAAGGAQPPRLGGRDRARGRHRRRLPARPELRGLSVPGLHGPRGRDAVLISLPACTRGLTAPLPADYQAGGQAAGPRAR